MCVCVCVCVCLYAFGLFAINVPLPPHQPDNFIRSLFQGGNGQFGFAFLDKERIGQIKIKLTTKKSVKSKCGRWMKSLQTKA